jgi:hypothetical protein
LARRGIAEDQRRRTATLLMERGLPSIVGGARWLSSDVSSASSLNDEASRAGNRPRSIGHLSSRCHEALTPFSVLQ